MQEKHSAFQTSDGIKIHTTRWLPDNDENIRAVILLIHGIGEYSRRYRHVAEAFTAQGFAVCTLDHRGHGRSEGVRTYFTDMNQPVEDLEIYYSQVKASYPHRPFFMYGHSMGALISLLFMLEHQADFAGWISQGSPLALDQSQPAPLVWAGKLAALIAPKARLTPAIGPEVLTHDSELIETYRQDPLADFKPTRVGMAANIINFSQRARKRLDEIRLPLLVLHGSADTLCPPSGSQLLYDRAGSKDKTLKMYPNLYHEIHNEPEKDEVFRDIVAWLETHLEHD